MKKLFYHSPFTGNHQPRLTFCALIDEARPEEIKVGVARCSKNDQFSKKKGRMIAEGRAAKVPFVLFANPERTVSTFVQTCKAITEGLRESGDTIYVLPMLVRDTRALTE